MGLFDLFGGGSGFKKHAERAVDKRAQALERIASIEYLCEDGSPEAIAVLLRRFGFYVEPSITDEEEKDRAFRGVVAAGPAALEPIRKHVRTAENLVWPLQILEEVLEEPEYVGEVLAILARLDTEYERDPQRKIDLLSLLQDRKDPRIAKEALRFLEDANETVRFHAVGAVLAQGDEEGTRETLLAFCAKEESVRIRTRILEGLCRLEWGVQGFRAEIEKVLTKGFSIDRAGMVKAAARPPPRPSPGKK